MTAPNRCLVTVIIITIIVIGIVAVVSLVMGFLTALYSPSDDNAVDTEQGGNNGRVESTMAPETEQEILYDEKGYSDQRIWLIHVGEFNHRIAYLDAQDEQPRGFDVDIVNAVCRLSRKRCRLVFDTYSNCYTDDIGRGLLDGYYHACAGWAKTYERGKTLIFGDAYFRVPGTVWVTRRGNPSNFDPRDVSGVVLGFIQTYAASPRCVNRLRNTQGLPLSDNQIQFYDTIDLLIEDLDNGMIDAGFIAAGLADESRIQQIGDELRSCTAGNSGVLARPTQAGVEFVQWWNEGVQRLLFSREYGEICDRLETVHGHKEGGGKEDYCFTEYL